MLSRMQYPCIKRIGLSVAAMMVIMSAAASGCSSKLETGYEPRALGSSNETRRGFYAQPFTPEARAARQYEESYGEEGGQPRY